MRRLLSVAVPDGLADDTEALAQALGKTKSEVVRDALRQHVMLERFAALRQHGRDQAEMLGIGPEDVEALVDEGRSARG